MVGASVATLTWMLAEELLVRPSPSFWRREIVWLPPLIATEKSKAPFWSVVC